MDLDREVRELKQIASVYAKRGKLPLAIQITRTTLDLQIGGLGDDALPCAETAYQLGEMMCDNNQFAEARPYFAKSVEIWAKHHPQDTLSTMWFTEALTRLQDDMERTSAMNNQRGADAESNGGDESRSTHVA